MQFGVVAESKRVALARGRKIVKQGFVEHFKIYSRRHR